MLKIGELSKHAKVSRDTLRFYEQQALLVPRHRSDSGYRLYDGEDVKKLDFILRARAVGFTLREIRELLALEVTRDQQSCHDIKQFVDHKIDVINEKIKDMQRIKQSLAALSNACCGGDEPATHCTILETLREHKDAIDQ